MEEVRGREMVVCVHTAPNLNQNTTMMMLNYHSKIFNEVCISKSKKSRHVKTRHTPDRQPFLSCVCMKARGEASDSREHSSCTIGHESPS